MKKETICKCKHICKFCLNYQESDTDDTCSAFSKTNPNCVTGEMDTVYDKCIDHNKDGNCKKYDENKYAIYNQKLLDAIHDYTFSKLDKDLEGNLVLHLCYQLKYALEGRDTNFYWQDYSWKYKYDDDGNYTKNYKKYIGRDI